MVVCTMEDVQKIEPVQKIRFFRPTVRRKTTRTLVASDLLETMQTGITKGRYVVFRAEKIARFMDRKVNLS